MGLFGKSFDEKVADAVRGAANTTPGVSNVSFELRGKVITLRGKADSREAANLVMSKVDQSVKADNIVNAIEVVKKPAPEAAPPQEKVAERIHEVVRGDTLGAIAQTYYGKASAYMKIFEANRDILDNPDLIKVGQKLRIPE